MILSHLLQGREDQLGHRRKPLWEGGAEGREGPHLLRHAPCHAPRPDPLVVFELLDGGGVDHGQGMGGDAMGRWRRLVMVLVLLVMDERLDGSLDVGEVGAVVGILAEVGRWQALAVGQTLGIWQLVTNEPLVVLLASPDITLNPDDINITLKLSSQDGYFLSQR